MSLNFAFNILCLSHIWAYNDISLIRRFFIIGLNSGQPKLFIKSKIITHFILLRLSHGEKEKSKWKEKYLDNNHEEQILPTLSVISLKT